MGGVGFWDVFAVCGGSANEVVGYSYVEISRATGEDVNPEMILAGWHAEW